MATGHTKWFDPNRGFGFVKSVDGQDYFVHYSDIQMEDFKELIEGDDVEFDTVETDKGLQAKNVKVV
jgi:cold shock protein